MKTLTLKQLEKHNRLEKVIIESLDSSLYRLLVLVEGEEALVTEKNGASLVKRNQNDLRELLAPFAIASLVLRHQSAYDEMIGQPVRSESNRLEIPLGKNVMPEMGA
ncbi:MAG: hypothetical protein C9356_14120 [Oleiphilus sp.]|nr:MAG: hypothetical protein C9356_14120 [Oleiphilus sp.]